MSKRMNSVLQEAVAQGLISSAVATSQNAGRPWAVVVMTAVAAWFAAIPLCILVVLVLLSGSTQNDGAFVAMGVLVLATALTMLYLAGKSLFVEQLGVASLIVGTALIGFGSFDSKSIQSSLGVMALLTILLAAGVPQSWLRALLAASFVSLLTLSVSYRDFYFTLTALPAEHVLNLIAFAWIGGLAILRQIEHRPENARIAGAMESILAGVGAMTVLLLALCSGKTFLLNAGPLSNALPFQTSTAVGATAASLVSVACALLGAAWVMRQWPALRSLWFAAVALTAACLCWFSVALGAVLLVCAVCAANGRRNLAVLAAASALWIVGAFYYQLAWPLGTKAVVLAACGAMLGAIARFGMPVEVPAAAPHPAPVTDPRWRRLLIGGAGMAVLLVANAAIWEKEELIRQGAPVFVELAPVDPRSLMQGDYMELNYAFPLAVDRSADDGANLVVRRAPNGIVTLLRIHKGETLAADEMLIELVRKKGHLTIASDAWYFAEGEAERWSRARYGEFRIDAEGKALLVGLRGPKLEKL
ncbi:GDYXXLXY domain-containing protein [Telluria sp. B2]